MHFLDFSSWENIKSENDQTFHTRIFLRVFSRARACWWRRKVSTTKFHTRAGQLTVINIQECPFFLIRLISARINTGGYFLIKFLNFFISPVWVSLNELVGHDEIFICNHMESWIIHFSMHMWLSLSSSQVSSLPTSFTCKKWGRNF